MTEKRPVWWEVVRERGYGLMIQAFLILRDEKNLSAEDDVGSYNFRMEIMQLAYDLRGEPDNLVNATAAMREAYDMRKMEKLL